MRHVTCAGQVDPAGLQPVSTTSHAGPTDGGVAERAERLFQASPYVGLRSILCEFHEGVLVLRGHVKSYYLKQLAQEMVRSLDGVGAIFNFVEVQQ